MRDCECAAVNRFLNRSGAGRVCGAVSGSLGSSRTDVERKWSLFGISLNVRFDQMDRPAFPPRNPLLLSHTGKQHSVKLQTLALSDTNSITIARVKLLVPKGISGYVLLHRLTRH